MPDSPVIALSTHMDDFNTSAITSVVAQLPSLIRLHQPDQKRHHKPDQEAAGMAMPLAAISGGPNAMC